MIKRKRKIRIPAAKDGLNTEMAGIPGVNGTQNPPVPPINGASIEAVSGTQQNVAPVGNAAQMFGGAGGLIGNTVAAAKGEVSTGQAALGGLAAGASLGAAFGPLGAGIGAVAGATIGTIASGLSGGKSAEMTSFTEFDEGKLAGFLRPGRRSAQKKELKRIRQNAYANRAAVEGTGQLQAEYNLEHGQMDTNTFAYGGSTNSLAYVDDGELISTPDGQISKVPELGRPTDSNLVSLPEGSRILSDTLKVPGTKKTFAQLGEEMMTTKKSKFNDKYAKNAAKLNEMNNKSIHDQLFEIQETVKAKKGIKRKYKDAVVTANLGDVIPYTEQPKYSKRYQLRQDGTLNFTANPDEVVNIGDTVIYKGTPYAIRSRYTTGNSNHAQWLAYPLQQENGVIDIYMPPKPVQQEVTPPTNYSRPITVAPKKAAPAKTRTVNKLKLSPADWIGDTDQWREPVDAWRRDWTAEDLPLQASEPEIKSPTDEIEVIDEQPTKTPLDITGLITNAASSLAGLAPILSNLNTKPEYQDPNYNPYARAIMTTMRNRRFDISPAMRNIERNRAISNYDAAQMNTNTGANLAFRLQNASNANRAIADIRSQESNVNNAYLGEYANMLNNLGQQWAAETTRVDDANMANRAQARNIRRAGLSGLSQWAQNRELMYNQRERDNAMLELYRDFLAQGFSNNTISNWNRYIRRGGNR